MSYVVSYSDAVKKQFKKLDKKILQKILEYMENIEKLQNPRSRGKRLVGNRSDFWRYRVCDYRVLCKIEDMYLTIFIIEVEHRKNVYKRR